MNFAVKVACGMSSARIRASVIAITIVGSVLVGCAQTPPAAPPVTAVVTPKPTPQPIVPANPESPPPAAVPAPSASAPLAPSAPSVSAFAPQRDPRIIATSEALTPTGKTRYACERGAGRADIQLPEGTTRICSRFPAMGPCQYERDACRASGGRVIRFDGVEITKEVEHEYDKQVQRFKLNAG